jgi:1-acyl-sn-glycerol-3-phosphate acyltransferase
MFILIQIKAVFVCLVLFVFVLAPACLLALPFGLKTRLKIVCPVWEFCQKLVLRYACHTHIDIAEDHRSDFLKKIPTEGLYIANHQSYIDIPLITTMYQVPPIMKKEVLYIPVIGQIGWASGGLPVSRGSQASRKKVFAETRHRMVDLRIGMQVYPEGTRSKTSHPKPYEEIKRTLMIFAFNEKLPVIPTSIYGSRGVLLPNGLINPFRHIGIIVHKEIFPQDYTDVDDFCRACWNKVTEGEAQMRAKLAPLNGN